MLVFGEKSEFKMKCPSCSSGLSSKRIILSPFTKEFRGEGHSYESLIFSEAVQGRQFETLNYVNIFYKKLLKTDDHKRIEVWNLCLFITPFVVSKIVDKSSRTCNRHQR